MPFPLSPEENENKKKFPHHKNIFNLTFLKKRKPEFLVTQQQQQASNDFMPIRLQKKKIPHNVTHV